MSSRDDSLRPGLFPHNAWYMAAWSNEVADNLLARRLLGIPVVIYRLGDDVVAQEDRCPHRFAPLSLGHKTESGIQCAYHGLHFDRTGACDRNPSGSGHVPPGTSVRIFPIIERHRMLWIWIGQADAADPSLIPDFSMVPPEDAPHDNLGNYLHVKANCLLEIDNLMDLSHVNFVHEGTLGNESMRSAEVQVSETDGAIRAELFMPETTGGFGPMSGKMCDQWLNMVWMPPTAMILEFGAVACGEEPVQDPRSIAFHIVTPETDRTTHYFYGSAGKFSEQEKELADFIRTAQTNAFLTEDNPMIEAVDERMEGSEFWTMRPAILPNDKAAIRVRRRLEKMCRDEGGSRQNSSLKSVDA